MGRSVREKKALGLRVNKTKAKKSRHWQRKKEKPWERNQRRQFAAERSGTFLPHLSDGWKERDECTVHLSRLPSSVHSKQDLIDVLDIFGTIEHVHIQPDLKFAFVYFSNELSAVAAVNANEVVIADKIVSIKAGCGTQDKHRSRSCPKEMHPNIQETSIHFEPEDESDIEKALVASASSVESVQDEVRYSASDDEATCASVSQLAPQPTQAPPWRMFNARGQENQQRPRPSSSREWKRMHEASEQVPPPPPRPRPRPSSSR